MLQKLAKVMLNADTTSGTAALRAFWIALGASFGTAFGVWMAMPSDHDAVFQKPIVVAFAVPAMVAFGWRGFVEGKSDSVRDAKGDLKPGDVGQANAGS